MEIRGDSLDFSMPLRGSGPRTASKTIVFPRDVTRAVAGMTGYLTEFSGGDDHHVGRIDIRLATELSGPAVTVTGTFGLRDWSGDWDDNYDGVINFVVLAQLESATAPPPRRDLMITGMELNQATQFFRTSRFLDAANVRPDNSIFLIEGKNTGIRVYVDYDSGSGLPLINALSGELIVANGAGSTMLAPINPGIVPKHDASINQALSNDTLNFMIPAGLSAGEVTVTCRVFDSAAPAEKSSAFSRTLVFTPVEPLNVFLVGVQTEQPAAPAPSQSAVAAAFSLLQSTYPRGLVQFTGFTTMDLAPQISGLMTNSGCGPGWSALLDQLRDLRGGSTDVYFGGLPPGISAAGVIGCSPVGDRVAASFIDLIATVPHEVGHSLGLQHDPCRGCSPPAQDPNNDYPRYGSFPSDSIGVFGFDPVTNTVFDPASATDFMTAFLPSIAWISPFTWQLLLPTVTGGPSPGGGMTLRGGEREMLFLGLEIARDRTVTRRPSFHHPAAIQGSSKEASGFTYEFQDSERHVLDCGQLHQDCTDCTCGHPGSGCCCWPKTTRDVVPYPAGAAYFMVYDGDKPIHEEAIPDPPSVKIEQRQAAHGGVQLGWSASDDAVAFLVHVRDPRSGVWRGIAPRTDETRIVIPTRFVQAAKQLVVRVLATSGIATGYAETVLESREQMPPDVTLTMTGAQSTADGPVAISAVPSVLATDPAGAQVPDRYVTWFSGQGETLARGRQVDLRQLPDGRHVVRAVVRGHGGRSVARSWVVERQGESFLLHAAIADPVRTPRGPEHEHPHPAPPRPTE